MATEQLPSSAPTPPPQLPLQPFQAWLGRLGLSGKILAGASLVGIIAVFLPLLTLSVEVGSPTGVSRFGSKTGASLPAVSASQSVMVLRDARGVLCLMGYAAALALAFVLYPPNGLGQKTLAWAGVGVGAFITLLGLWLLIVAFNGTAGLTGFGGSFKISVGIGAILNLLAGAAVAAGGVLKAREEQLI